MKKLVCLILALVMILALFAGCSKDGSDSAKATKTPKPTPTPDDGIYVLEPLKYADTVDMPDWPGKQITWRTDAGGDKAVPNCPNDLILPEIKRVTGVWEDRENALTNAGTDGSEKMALWVASGDWPNIVDTLYGAKTELIRRGLVWDITDWMPRFMDSYLQLHPLEFMGDYYFKPVYDEEADRTKRYGIIEGLRYEITDSYNRYIQEKFGNDFYPELFSGRFDLPYDITKAPGNPRGWLEIREDVLQLAYADRDDIHILSIQELKDIYVASEKGTFTWDEFFNVPLYGRDEFDDFLYRVKAVIDSGAVKSLDGKPMYVLHAKFWTDNGAQEMFYGTYSQLQGYSYHGMSYPTMWDYELGELVYAHEDPRFKQYAEDLNRWIRDGIIPKESLLDGWDEFYTKLNNGQYAIAQAYTNPDNNLFRDTDIYYRRVFFGSKENQQARFNTMVPNGLGRMFPKASNPEEDMPQFLMHWDYLYSPVGQLLTKTGPRGGIWEFKDDGKKYLLEELADDLIQEFWYASDNTRPTWVKYGLINYALAADDVRGFGFPNLMFNGWNTLGDILMNSFQYGKPAPEPEDPNATQPPRDPDGWSHAMNMAGYAEPLVPLIRAPEPRSYHKNFADLGLPQVAEAHKKMETYEQSLMSTIGGFTDEEFEQKWASFVDSAVNIVGWTEEVRVELMRLYVEECRDFPEGMKAIGDKWKK